jgi:hypothetical protein
MSADHANRTAHSSPRRWLRFSLAGLLFFVFCWAGLWAGFRLGSQRIALNPDPLSLTVAQRSTQAIPGLQGLAHVQLQDITRGQVVLSIHDEGKRQILAPRSVQSGDVLTFNVKGQTFFLHVRHLENQLIGDDRATLEISTSDRWSTASAPSTGKVTQKNAPVQAP